MNFNTDEQLSGFFEIDFYLLTEVSNWPMVLTDFNSSQLVFSEAALIKNYNKAESLLVEDNKTTEPQGILHNISIKMSFNTRGQAMENMLEKYENKPGIALAKLNNGYKRIYGSNLEPLFLVYENKDGSKINVEGATTIEIKGKTSKRPVYYSV